MTSVPHCVVRSPHATVYDMTSPATSVPAAPASTTGCVDGLITMPTEDGPEYAACHCSTCTPPIVARYVPGQRGFTAEMLADMGTDEEF